MTDSVDWYRRLLWIGLAWVLIQIPFASGAFRIDEPYHLQAVQQLLKSPTDPYGFYINWHGTPEWAFHTYASPPLVPAWLALWSTLFPWNEFSLHLAMLPFSLAGLLVFGSLAKHFKVDAEVAMALLACSPVFFLTSQVVMPDIAMLCMFLVAVTGARSYQVSGSLPVILISCVAGFCCPLAKYNGAVLVPVLICLGVARPRRMGMLCIVIAPVLSLLLWGGFTWAKYGAVHFLAMSAYQKNPEMSAHPIVLTVGVLAVTGLGGLPISLLAFLSSSHKRSRVLIGIGAVVLVGSVWLAIWLGYGLSSVLLFSISVTVAIYVVGLTILQVWQSLRLFEWSFMPLVTWILVGFAFQFGLMFAATRYILFLAPPLILLVLRLSAWVPRKSTLAITFAMNLLFTVALAIGDRKIASVYRDVVKDEIRPSLENQKGRFYFAGHWGFQYYADRVGGELIDLLNPPVLRAGDVVVVAKMPWPGMLEPKLSPGLEFETATRAVESSWFIRTLSCEAGASFYGHAMAGCERPTFLPFGFSSGPVETFLMYRIMKK